MTLLESRLLGEISTTSDVQRISYEMWGWMNHKLESRLPGEIPTTSDMQIILL